MSNIMKTIKYLFALGVTLFSLSCLYLSWIWRDGLLNPQTTNEIIISDMEYLGPWGILLDIFILYLIYFVFKKSRKKPVIVENPWLSEEPNFGPLLLEHEKLPLPPIPPSPEELELLNALKE
jgi:hypothetical protein